jgi:hypothetical protein
MLTYADSDHLGNLTPCRGQDGFKVLAALLRLLRDRARHQTARAVGGDLPGHEHLAGGFDGLAVGSGGCLFAERNGQSMSTERKMALASSDNKNVLVYYSRGQASLVKTGVNPDILAGLVWN